MISERNGRFGVRVYLGHNKWKWVGTYPTREAAEEADRESQVPKRRTCTKCARRFLPVDDRRVRCDRCVRKDQPSNDDHWLYRCFDSGNNLLYIGITSAGIKRFRAHGNDKSWWQQIDTIKLSHYATAEDARREEKRLIRELQPPFNIADKALAASLAYEPPDNVISFPVRGFQGGDWAA